VDFEKGCFVGQEVVSRIHNRGQPSKRLVGLTVEDVPERGAAVFDGESAVGEVTRGLQSPTLDEPIAMALVEAGSLASGDGPEGADGTSLTVRVDGDEVAATVVDLPFVDGSDRSGRLPRY